MRINVQRPWLTGALVLALAALTFVTESVRSREALADGKKTTKEPGANNRTVSFLNEVRPILAQHCFQCHGPDEAKRKGRLRLDLKENAFAAREGAHVIAPKDPDDSLVWKRITTDDKSERMPPDGKGEPLSTKQIATLKTWIEQGARWEDHWSFLPPRKPALPTVSDKAWVRDPLDAFVLARLDREHLKPEAEATREAWLRRASFDLTGIPPTLEELDAFLSDKRSDAYETQVERMLKSKRYGERQAQEWLDLARYADTSGYQNDIPRQIWKWRDWVLDAFNANMPFDQFTIEQLAGDLLPGATLAQKVATGFNRNHPTNSEAGEEEDEYRSAYVVDRVNTTATVFMGLTLACAQCHDHKYDPITQRDYYSFYSFFNNIKERDSDFGNPRPFIPVPNSDQAPRLADLKVRIDALKKRLEQDDAPTDAAQKEWERKTLARLGKPISWTIPPVSGMLSHGGAQLKPLPDGSILSTGPAPVKDIYDIMVLPGKKHITALRLELLPDDSTPQKSLGRGSDGRFVLSTIEIRNTTFSESQDPPLVYLSLAEADINQKPKEDPAPTDIPPGSIESAVTIEPIGSGYAFGGWSIVDDELKHRHDAIFLPLEPLDTNDASVLRFSLRQMSPFRFKNLIGRFRISYTEDERIRELMLPSLPKAWSWIGPFFATDVAKAYATVFEPEKDIKNEPIDLKKSYTKVMPPPPAAPESAEKPAAPAAEAKPAAEPMAAKKEASKPEQPAKPEQAAKPEQPAKPKAEARKNKTRVPVTLTDKPPAAPAKEAKAEPKPEIAAAKPADAKKPSTPKPKAETISWTEQRKWRDGTPARLEGGNSAYYLTRKIVSTRPRTATIHFAGPAGFRIWINGELAQTSAPPPPAPAAKPAAPKPAAPANAPDAKPDDKPDDEKEEPVLPEINDTAFDGSMGRAQFNQEKKFRIGLRQGDNEIVIKAVFAAGSGAAPSRMTPAGAQPGPGGASTGGGSFTFKITPDGDDVVNHEVVTALRLEAQPPSAADKKGAVAPASAPTAPPTATASTAAGAANAAKAVAEAEWANKVSKVGEKSAPPRPPEQENKLSPSERRKKVLREYYRSHVDPVGRIVAEELAKLKDEEKIVKQRLPQTLVMEELDKPRQAFIFQRGVYKNRGENVSPATPAVLPPLPKGAPRNRLGLAQWLVSKEHPLTARVHVNRIWKQYFGVGIVRTAEDFGIRAEPPTHPELLDYLAAELVESKWDMKKLHRRIVLSATYRQASTTSKSKLDRDPENLLLAHGPRLRLSAEMIRDNALSVSGLLVEKIGGESVKPAQPKNAWNTVEGFMANAYRRDRDEKQYRRALYVYWKRGSPYPSMLNFDAVKRDGCTVSRATTTTPVQALTLLNDPVYIECAKMLGQRMLKDREAVRRARDLTKPQEDAKRLAYGFRLCTSRQPSEQDLQILRKLLDEQRAQFKADASAATKLLKVGDAKVDETFDAAEAAAWACVGSALINLDATIHR